MKKARKVASKLMCGLFLLSMILMLMPTVSLADSPQQLITKDPVSVSVPEGSTAVFSVEATGENLSYLWQYKAATATKWADWTTQTSATVSVGYLSVRNGLNLRCKVTDGTGHTETSGVAILTYVTPTPAIVITKNPEDVTVTEGSNAVFTVEATGENLSYLWQYKTATATRWADWTSQTSATANVGYLSARNGMSLRCKITDGAGNTETSGVATLTYVAPTPAIVITKNPESVTVLEGNAAVFSVEATGENLSYLWQYKTVNATRWADWTSQTSATATVGYLSARNGMSLRCKITDSAGHTETSGEATLTYGTPAPAIVITKNPESVTVPEGSKAIFSVEATGNNLSYLWQYKTVNATRWADWTSQTKATVEVGYLSARNGMSLRCKVTDAAGNTETSDIATLNYAAPVTVTYDAGSGTFGNNQHTYIQTVNPGRYFILCTDEQGNIIHPVLPGYKFEGWLYNGRNMDWITVSSDITLTAKWVKAYNVTYNANGGSFPTDGEFEHATEWGYTFNQGRTTMTEALEVGPHFIPDWIEPVRPGYNFLGWMKDGKLTPMVDVTNANITLTAAWEQGYTLTYNANGGHWAFEDEDGDGKLDEFSTVDLTLPAGICYLGWHEPEREGYRFDGWTVGGRSVRRINLQSNVTVTAKWKKICQVTYDANGGAFEYVWDDESERYIEGGDKMVRIRDAGECWIGIGEEEEPYYVYTESDWGSDKKYVFCGWSTNKNATAAGAQKNFSINLTDDITLYAIYGAGGSIMLDGNEGFMWEDNEQCDFIYRYCDPVDGYELNEEAGGRDGYEFLGWAPSADATVPTYRHGERIYTSEDLKLYAVWSQMPTVTYDANGGAWTYFDENLQKDVTECYRYDWRSYGKKYHVRYWQPERDGYRFVGWYDPADQTQTIVDEAVPIVMNKNYTFKAKWIKEITVTYNANGGSWGNETTRTWTGDEGQVHIGQEWPSKKVNDVEYCFLGWSTNQNATVAATDFDVELHANATYYAIWHLPVTVTYDANGGWLWDTPNGKITVDIRQNVRCGDFDVDQWANRDGYEFLGWSTDAEATTPEYSIHAEGEDRRAYLTEDTTFYAVWKKLPWVIYDANGGWWGEDNENTLNVDEREYVQYDWDNVGYYYYIGHHNPYRPGYEFNGWVDAEGKNVDDNEIIMQDGVDITVRASWCKIINVTYDANGGVFDDWGNEIESHTQYDVRAGRDYGLDMWEPRFILTDEDDNYISEKFFMGWSLDPNGTVPLSNPWVIPNTIQTDENNCITLYAIWEDGITVTYDANCYDGGWRCDIDGGGFYYDHSRVDGPYRRDGNLNYHVGFWWPERFGYMFVGWSASPNAEDADTDFDVVLTDSVTYYAIWDKCPAVTFDAGEGIFTDVSDYIDYMSITAVVVETTRGGNADGNPGGLVFEDEDPELSVIKLPWRFGDTLEAWQDWYSSDVLAMNIAPKREGFEFVGWVDENGDYFNYKRITSDVTVRAEWSRWVTLRFDYDDGIMMGEWEGCEEGFHCNEVVNLLEYLPHREGFEFIGWADETDQLITEQWLIIGEEDICLHAVWNEPDQFYTVTFDGNGGLYYIGEEPSETCTFELSGLYGYSSLPIPEREGNYEFDYYTIDLGDEEEHEFWGASLIDSDTAFVAHWRELVVKSVELFSDNRRELNTEDTIYLYADIKGEYNNFVWQVMIGEGEWCDLESEDAYTYDYIPLEGGTYTFRLVVGGVSSNEITFTVFEGNGRVPIYYQIFQ